jgi:hypothetical protein
MQRAALVLLALFACFSDVPPSQSAPARGEGVPADTVISLQRDACERRCAVYKVTIRADGTVIFDGQYFVRRTGRLSAKVSPAEVRGLINEFMAADYFSLKDEYSTSAADPCAANPSDAPTATTSLVIGGRSKSVVHDHHCIGPVADRLTALENKIDKVAGSVRWIR